jgi:hypothetical protein
VTHGIDAAVDAVEAASPYPAPDARGAQAKVDKLGKGNDPVLLPRERREGAVKGGSRSFRFTMHRNERNPLHGPHSGGSGVTALRAGVMSS